MFVEILVRKIIRQLGKSLQFTGAYFDDNPKNQRFFQPASGKAQKLAFIIPSAFYTVLVVRAPTGQLIRLTFFLEHDEVLLLICF